MAVLAVTGGIAAGKTLVCSTLRSLGAVVIDADVLAREAVAPGTQALAQIAERFGSDLVLDDGSLDRKELGSRVFGDAGALGDLNAIVHPEVRRLYSTAVQSAGLQNPNSVVVYDVPLLAEARSTEEFDAVVVVHAPAELRIRRLVELRGFSQQDAEARVNSQASDDERLALATVVIDSSVSEEETKRQSRELFHAAVALWPNRLGELPRHFPQPTS